MREEMLELTREMVAVPSVNTTSGEKDIGIFIENYLREIPYFKQHPEQVVIQTLKDDCLQRRNVFALLCGEKDENPNTIIFHGHTDTVGVEDYGPLQEAAFDTAALEKELAKVELPKEVREDLESGDYLFGRGACDMKSGDAVFMVLIRHIADHVKELSGNILLSLNPVEENLHTGIIEGIETFELLKNKYGLNYILAINNDYTCPMYPGDTNQYLYTGVGGKLLPCFYIQGRETHVGQCFEGYDATVVAARLTSEISFHTEFCDSYGGEYSLPPVALKLKDLKGWYNVQTAKEALVYFNYFVHNASTNEILSKLKKTAEKAVSDTMKDLNQNYKDFCELSGKEYVPIPNAWSVLTYEKLYQLASANCKELDELLATMTEEGLQKNEDKRELPIRLIRMMLEKAGIYHPVVVLYFAAPYCPHNTLKSEEVQDKRIMDKLRQITDEVEKETKVHYEICQFFPSLSDSSYLCIDDPQESTESLKRNFPQMEQLYPLPFEKMRALGIKSVNFGVHGKDAHKWTERLYMPYSFEVLPKLIIKTLQKFL